MKQLLVDLIMIKMLIHWKDIKLKRNDAKVKIVIKED